MTSLSTIADSRRAVAEKRLPPGTAQLL